MKKISLLSVLIAIAFIPAQSVAQVSSSYMDQFMYTYLIDGYYYYLLKSFYPDSSRLLQLR